MRSILLSILLLFLLSGLYGSDQQIFLGEADLWENVNLTNLTLIPGKRGYLDITNQDNTHKPDKHSDMIFPFNSNSLADETGHYELISPLTLSTQEGSFGGSAALFAGSEPLLIQKKASSLFSPSTIWDDFSLEFRLYPATLKEGSTIFLWKGLQMVDNQLIPQEIRCTVNNRKLVWDFENFFLYPDSSLNRVTLEGEKLIPREWTHHQILFNSETGLLEYRIDNVPADSTHTSKSGRESVEFNIPVIGNQQSFPIELGENFTGLIDELSLTRSISQQPQLNRYTDSGYMESKIIDLQSPDSTLFLIEAEQHLPDNTSIVYDFALAQSKIDLLGPNVKWENYIVGNPINRKGRFLKIRARLFAEPAVDSAPVLSSLTIIYREAAPPHPPLNVAITVSDGIFLISWDKSIDPTIDGYMIYYGDQPGVYFAEGSPVDAGNNSSYLLEKLDKNRRYYFSVTSYRNDDRRIESRFSREISYSP
ncbi:fibronectin type III domain-containing protein [Spirochaeta isovalerica]|uniref:Fibronectin type-III domain-containing protein n=1 Tax=Spirochaeta isovalerica TaxID=150 RepID=A0A841RJ36_9SPIO|nr:fibronectin type III domain-containing protein [Spirochaeta isovalerica]MBB6482312.1 hypothetical protein [Spirochaeta isovalerica]